MVATRKRAKSKGPARKPAEKSDSNEQPSYFTFQFDEAVSARLALVPRRELLFLHVDHYTLLERINDITTLRAGDHIVVAINPIRKIHPVIDALILLAWPILLPLGTHHFTVLEDVASVESGTGDPLNASGGPVQIAEYSNTPLEAVKYILDFGAKDLAKNLAPFFALDLAEYSRPAGPGTLFRVLELPSETERQGIVRRARKLLKNFDRRGRMLTDDPVRRERLRYDLLLHNCEHAANALRAPKSRHAVSPQVPNALWNAFRVMVQLLGVMSLVFELGPSTITSHNRNGAALYHMLVTFVCAMQTVVLLMRVCVNLTRRRYRDPDLLPRSVFWNLFWRESGKSVLAGGAATAELVCLPLIFFDREGRWVDWRIGNGEPSADFAPWILLWLALTAQMRWAALYSFLAQLVTALCERLLGGVPVLVLKDVRMGSRKRRRRKRVIQGS